MGSWGRWICARVAGEALGIGCDKGEITVRLEREGYPVALADPARAGALPFEDESFDTVVLGEFLAEQLNRSRSVGEARRVLRPGGRLLVAVAYRGATGEDEVGISLERLLDDLAEFSVKEIATVGERLCLQAERSREKSRAAVWRRALGAAEQRLAEREGAAVALAASVTEVEASRVREERALADARGDVVRLETALAAATHRRDLAREKERLAREGVAELQRRLERLGRDRDRERLEAERALERQAAEAERQLTEARVRLEEGQAELGRIRAAARQAQDQLATRDAELAARDAELAARDAELQRLRAGSREQERKLALGEQRLEKAQQRAEGFRRSLVALREGRSYRLMRVFWRLRRPFRRAPRDAGSGKTPAVEPDADSSHRAAHPRPPREPGARLRVAAVLDEMSAACFAPECDLLPLTLEGWREQLDEHGPDLLLVESAWNGNGGEWQHRIARYPREDLAGLPALRALLDGCRERGIPTAFWNKEDPVHFERFAEAASLFDHVFTTDARCVERYRELPGERTVAPLPFAAQPRIHNPAAVVPERSASPCFAGAWYRDRHPDRRRALEALLDAARPHGLVIYDRRFGGKNDAFGFPERFAPHVLGNLPYEGILDVYKSHLIFLNANSVADSPTMCSRRVFELAACDTAILSTPGVALSALLGEGVVAEVGDEQSAAAALERLLGDEAGRRRRTRAARRAVFAAHTYADRMAAIATAAGLDASSLGRRPFAPPRDSVAGVGAASNGEPSANGMGASAHPWLLALQAGVTLGEPALADLAAAASFADADVIGAHPAGNGEVAVEHRHVSNLDPRALLLRRELVAARGAPAGSPDQIDTQLRRWCDEGVRLYAADADILSGREAHTPAAGAR